MVLAFQVERGVDEAERSEMELRAVVEERTPVREAWNRRRWRQPGASARAAQLPLGIRLGQLVRTERLQRLGQAAVRACGGCREAPRVGQGHRRVPHRWARRRRGARNHTPKHTSELTVADEDGSARYMTGSSL